MSLGVCRSASWGAGASRLLTGTCLTVEKVFTFFVLPALRSNHSQIERKMALLVLYSPFDLCPFQDYTLQSSPGLHQEQKVPGTSWFRLGRLLINPRGGGGGQQPSVGPEGSDVTGRTGVGHLGRMSNRELGTLVLSGGDSQQ